MDENVVKSQNTTQSSSNPSTKLDSLVQKNQMRFDQTIRNQRIYKELPQILDIFFSKDNGSLPLVKLNSFSI